MCGSVTELTDMFGSGGVGVAAQFNVEAVFGAAESEGLRAEVIGALVEVVGRVEGRMQEAVGVQFGVMGRWGAVFDPPSAVFTLEVGFEWFGVGRDVCWCDVVGLEEAPCIIPS